MAEAISDAEKAWQKTKKRISKEKKLLDKLAKNADSPINGATYTTNETEKRIELFIKFGGGGAYAGSNFVMKIGIPSGYPFSAPSMVAFNHKVYHPSVDISTNDICPNTLDLEKWKPTRKLDSFVTHMHNAMSEMPKEVLQGALNTDCAQQYINDVKAFEKELKKLLKKKEFKCGKLPQ